MNRYRQCRLCPRNCGVNRTGGELGVCGERAVCRVASIGPHFGEEPVFSGRRGSGTIFFAGCSSGCFFCQNHQVSLEHIGHEMTIDALDREVRALVDRGVHNLNFVTPDHFWPHVEALCRRLRRDGIELPTLFNGSGYQLPKRVGEYARVIDIFLPDFKFAESALAERVMGARDYPEVARRAIAAMVEHKGFLEPWDPTGAETARSGVLVRHLILPGHVANSVAVLEQLRADFGPHLPLSVMSQFHPVPNCRDRRLLTRRITREEHEVVRDAVEVLGFRNVFVQERDPGAEFLPNFEREEPFEGNTRALPFFPELSS